MAYVLTPKLHSNFRSKCVSFNSYGLRYTVILSVDFGKPDVIEYHTSHLVSDTEKVIIHKFGRFNSIVKPRADDLLRRISSCSRHSADEHCPIIQTNEIFRRTSKFFTKSEHPGTQNLRGQPQIFRPIKKPWTNPSLVLGFILRILFQADYLTEFCR